MYHATSVYFNETLLSCFVSIIHGRDDMSSSLRDLYSDPSSAWSFVQALPAAASNSSPPASSSSYQWSSRPSHNSIFDLSPELGDPSDGIDPINLLKTLAASAILQYTSSAIAMPWEVGKLLLQVQWVPRDAGEPDPSDAPDDDDDAVGGLFAHHLSLVLTLSVLS
jgi:fusion and transport protein UGO1